MHMLVFRAHDLFYIASMYPPIVLITWYEYDYETVDMTESKTVTSNGKSKFNFLLQRYHIYNKINNICIVLLMTYIIYYYA